MHSAQIEKAIAYHLDRALPLHPMKEVYLYSVLPGGKFFRPHLVWAVLNDCSSQLFLRSKDDVRSAHALLATAIELHHSYTLIHDDLPCMDDDLTRRGKPCTHIAFGEWRALLAGDGLLNVSYQLLAKIDHAHLSSLLRFFSWAMGPKGLIHGQALDLNQEMTHSFAHTLRTHELKTARLIQAAVLGSALLANPQQTRETQREKLLWKYSRLLGVNFQFIDDLSELAEKELSTHEKDVNPWLRFPQETLEHVLQGLRQFEQIAKKTALPQTDAIVVEYYQKMLGVIGPNLPVIEGHLEGQGLKLAPMILAMKGFSDR